MKNPSHDWISLKVVREVIKEQGDDQTPSKGRKRLVNKDKFLKWGVEKIEPHINIKTGKKCKSTCVIFYKPTNQYYKIAESINSVFAKVETLSTTQQIGFKYSNYNK